MWTFIPLGILLFAILFLYEPRETFIRHKKPLGKQPDWEAVTAGKGYVMRESQSITVGSYVSISLFDDPDAYHDDGTKRRWEVVSIESGRCALQSGPWRTHKWLSDLRPYGEYPNEEWE